MADAVSPDTVCVMGGPNIPLEDEARKQFIRRYSQIDFYASLEGEAFVNLIRRAMDTGVDRQE
jgi:hypothetical protein